MEQPPLQKGFNKTAIDGNTITMGTVPALDAMRLEVKISSLIAKVASNADWSELSKLVNSGKLNDFSGDTSKVIAENEELIKGIFSAASSIDPELVFNLVEELVAYAFVNGGSGEDFEGCFAGKPGLALKVAFFVAKVTFGDFIRAMFANNTDVDTVNIQE